MKENNLMETQDIRKTLEAVDTASEEDEEHGDEVVIEEVDTDAAEGEDQMEEASSLAMKDFEEEGKVATEHEEDSTTPSSTHGKSRKSKAAKMQYTPGRSLSK